MKPDRPSSWKTARELAEFLDCSVEYFRREIVRELPSKAIRRGGGRVFYHGRTCLEKWGRMQIPRWMASAQTGSLPLELEDDLEVDLATLKINLDTGT